MKLFETLIKEEIKFAVAESFTGGLFANTATNVPGISKVFKGAHIVYDNDSKIKQLKVRKETLDAHGAISKETATEMAVQAMIQAEADIGISFTGNAGPGAAEEKEVGLIYIGLIFREKVNIIEKRLKGDRESIKKQAVDIAIKELEKML
jgi:PncC family amidohydrolase